MPQLVHGSLGGCVGGTGDTLSRQGMWNLARDDREKEEPSMTVVLLTWLIGQMVMSPVRTR